MRISLYQMFNIGSYIVESNDGYTQCKEFENKLHFRTSCTRFISFKEVVWC